MSVLTVSAERHAEAEFHLAEIIHASDSQALKKALNTLHSGEALVAPTDTRYGLLGRADKAHTLERLFEVKRRPSEMVSAVFVASVNDIERWATVTHAAKELRNAFLPGPLTLVLPASDEAKRNLAPQVIHNGEIGIRVSDSSFIAQLLGESSFPVTATSANISGQAQRCDIAGIAEQFGDSVSLYIDGGELAGDVSTVVRCVTEQVEILREGALSFAEIQAAVGDSSKVIHHG